MCQSVAAILFSIKRLGQRSGQFGPLLNLMRAQPSWCFPARDRRGLAHGSGMRQRIGVAMDEIPPSSASHPNLSDAQRPVLLGQAADAPALALDEGKHDHIGRRVAFDEFEARRPPVNCAAMTSRRASLPSKP